MKTVITALANPELNKELRKINEFKIVTPDIQYQEGIFEVLEDKEVDILILSELLKGNDELKDLIQKIKEKSPNIKIILLLEKENIEKIEIAKQAKVEKILFHHKITINEMIQLLKEIPVETNIEEEIRNIKKLIMQNKMPQKRNAIEKIKEKIKRKTKKEIQLENKIIAVAGGHGTGKSFITSCFAMQLKKEKKKILILDFDLLNENIHTIFGQKKIPKKIKKKIEQNNSYIPRNYQEYKIKINSHIDLISGSSFLFSEGKVNILKLEQLLEKSKKEYDVILMDVSSECYLDYSKFLLQISNTILFLTEGNLLEIKKAIHLLDIYTKEWNIEKEKIKIVFNKYHKNAIDEKILKTIFMEYTILGNIKWNKNYTIWINQNMQRYSLSKKEEKQHRKILQGILGKQQTSMLKKMINGRLLWRT